MAENPRADLESEGLRQAPKQAQQPEHSAEPYLVAFSAAVTPPLATMAPPTMPTPMK